VATFTQLASGNWRVQVRRKTRYVAETFRRRKDGEEWALEMERNIDRNGSSKPRVGRNVRTFEQSSRNFTDALALVRKISRGKASRCICMRLCERQMPKLRGAFLRRHRA
jgi:hypothetical protein